MAKNKSGAIKAKKSAWSTFSIWWGVLVFGLIIPLALILFYVADYSVYVEELPKHIQGLGNEKIQTVEAYREAVKNGVLSGADIYQGGMLGLTDMLFVKNGMSWADVETVAEICLGAGIVCFVLAVFNLVRKIACAKKTSYEFSNNTLILKKGRLFASAEEIRRLAFFPGMSVSVKQGLKGRLLGYGDVVVSMGLGEAGEVVMAGVKRPRRLKKKIARAIKTNCVANPYMHNPYMNMPYAMPPHTYTFNYPANNG